MPMPLMPKATAVWLVENTALTFEQIGDFCGLHKLEVQAIADGEVATGIMGLDPVINGQLVAEEIKRCENDSRAKLKMVRSDLPQPVARSKGPRYTPVSKRADKPDAIAYLIKSHPELLDAQIARLLGTTKDTIEKVRDRSHWNSSNIKPRNPVLVGLCKQSDLDSALKRAQRRVIRERKAAGIVDEPLPPAPVPQEEIEVEIEVEQEDTSYRPNLDPESIFKK
ncbi:MAG: DUF1013 domain-containing protein [Alphaproteobacteria bacterium]|nr:DUF1013 domain-containing protein [Alphaproteobacteria bacterium]